jgi:gamma-butyrobetaine dioxygenase
MTPDEAAAFESLAHSADAVRVRRWDDRGKVAGRAVPPFDHYRPLLGDVVRIGTFTDT